MLDIPIDTVGGTEREKKQHDMSSLRVLVLGDSPNTLLYASRFQLAKSVDLYHVSDGVSAVFEIETVAYGYDKFELAHHFRSVGELVGAVSGVFDLIILSASSLQELSSVAAQLKNLVNSNTKIFLESSGFVQLEPFVKMSMDAAHANIFSIVTDFDVRQVAPNSYKQFPLNNVTKNSLWLGECKPAKGGSSSYSKNVVALLETFERLFQKLFPKDTVDLCNKSPVDFLSKQWSIAMPRICFDPLLIMLEETNPAELNNQIIAKPLISGLVTEVITVARSMGAKLNNTMDNETNLLQSWKEQYCLSTHEIETPALVYHFIHRSGPLNIDMSLLQIILLADDFGIKTPYLEFLYSVMSQYQKLNEGKSKWFKRVDERQQQNDGSNFEMAALIEEKAQLNEKLNSLTQDVKSKDEKIQSLMQERNQNAQMSGDLQNQLDILRNELNKEKQKSSLAIQEYENKLNATNNAMEQMKLQTAAPAIKNIAQDEYKPTGTPNLNDIADIAVFGVNYNSPEVHKATEPLAGKEADRNESQEKLTPTNDSMDDLKRRELELRKKELELQEKEIEFQKLAMQQQQKQPALQNPQQFPVQQQQPFQVPPHQQGQAWGKGQQMVAPQQMPMSNSGGNIPQMMNGNSRKPSFPQVQQAANIRNSRAVHGAMPTQQQSTASNFVDPVSAGLVNNSFEQNTQGQFMPQQGHMPQNVKRTSRKNRHSNMPNIGSASSMGLNNFSSVGNNGSQSRLNSLSTSNMPAIQNRLRHTNSNLALNNINNKSSSRLNMPQPVKQGEAPMNGGALGNPSQQRQMSSSTQLDNVGDISTNSVIHNSIPYQNGGMETSNSQPQLQQYQNTQTQNTKEYTQSPPPMHQFGSSNNGSPVAAPTATFSSSQDSGINGSTDEEASEKEGKKKDLGSSKRTRRNN